MTSTPSDQLTVTITRGDVVASVSVSHPERLDFMAAAVKRALQEYLLMTGQPVTELKVTLQ